MTTPRLLIAALTTVVITLGQGQPTPPKITSKTEPQYSEDARAAGIQGIVVIQFDVGEDGLPCDIHVTQPLHPSLDQKAVEAAKQWRFQPATEAGHPRVWKNVTAQIQFRLEESPEHKFARRQHENAVQSADELYKRYQETLDALARLPKRRGKSASDQEKALLAEMRRLGDEHHAVVSQLDGLTFRMEHADDCLKIFNETIDKKMSDMTTRDTEGAQMCRSANLYPPPK
jgi:TonB family protein